MPSVGMRRTTRVFGVVKGLDGARVLRSGRRLWRESSEGKIRRGNDGDEWYKLMDNFGGGLNSEENGWHEVGSKRVVVDAVKTGGKTAMPKSRKKTAPIDCNDYGSVDKRFGAVYIRKRRKLDAKNSDFSENNKRGCSDDRMYGLHFVRRKRRKRRSESPVVDAGTCSSDDVSCRSRVLVVGVESSCSNACWLSVFLNSVLGYMKRARIRLRELSAFLLSESITDAFSLHGIRFSLDLLCSSRSGICKIFGARQLTPLFSADFSALPLCFIYMHSSMLLRSERLLFVLVIRSENLNVDDEPLTDSEDNLLCTPSMDDLPDNEFVASGDDNLLNRSVLHPIVGAPKLSRRNALCRNGLNSRSIRGKSIRRKRSSLRSRRARNPSLSVHKAYNGYFGSEFFSIRNDRSPLSSSLSARGARGAVKSKLVENIKDLKSAAVGLAEDMESTCCSANILVIETDRCYREERANIMLELSSSNQWFLVVKRDGLTRYSHKAENVMRPCASNRFTHDIIWTTEDGWKLEFPNRGDWFIFKELYKECSHRNLQAPVEKFIPVPGVLEVSGYGDSCDAPFLRPDSYITLDGDEVSRALANRTSNYDMDSEDEEWLNQFNNESCAGNDFYEHVTEDNFELMFDAFEKAFYCSPDDYSDEKAASSLCPDLGRREVIQAVYKYWMKKRKQKRSALVSFFQGHQPRRSQLSTESVLRKKRSFKRQPSQCARGKQRLVMQAIAAEKEALHEQNATLNIEEAKVCAKKSAEEAVSKRKRAQLLMENADLATYKATLALRIAEAARVVELPDVATAYFLD